MGRNLQMARKLSNKSYNATDNTYESSSGSDSDESNASLLERSCLLSNKFMLPKDLCENDNIFNEFFSRSLWDTLPQATQQKLAKLLPVAKDDMPSATKVVHDLLSHRKLHRFDKEPMDNFRHKLADGNFRVDVAKLQHNLAELTTKDRRMVELQRISRLAPNVLLSREAVLYSELHSNDVGALSSTGRVTDTYDHRRRRNFNFHVTSAMEKCQTIAKKRYLSEIINICDEVGLPMTLSDEEDCMHALPTGTVRKQRRLVGNGPQSGDQPNLQPRLGLFGGSNGTAGNTIDGTIFNAPKLFLVTEEHYRKLMLQHRKRKMEEPDHPELELDNVKLKDVVSRTQIAAGYRRILPLPKVYISDAVKENSTTMKAKVKSQKSLKMHRSSLDQIDSKTTFDRNFGENSVDRVKVKSEPTVVIKDEQPSNECFNSNVNENAVSTIVSTKQNARSEEKSTLFKNEPVKESKKNTNPIEDTKLETVETVLTTTVAGTTQSSNPLSSASLPDAMVENAEPTAVEQNFMNSLFSNGTHACFLSVVRDLFCSNPDHRSTLPELQLKLDAWAKSPVAECNVWFDQYRTNGEWNETLQSAVQFLAGEFLNQPEDFVPYIEHKVALNILQWIGASRDGDSRLVPLCAYWQSRKQEINNPSSLHSLTTSNTPSTVNSIVNDSSFTQVVASPKSRSRSAAGSKHVPFSPSYSSSSSMSSVSSLPIAGDNSVSLFNDSNTSSLSIKTTTVSEDDGSINERSTATPPPLFPTDWTVRKATDEEVQLFREQEKRRYENPHMAFTYKQHSYDSVVGPVKGIYTQAPGISKARGHSMLVANRPNFVTILTLVRDATARLPNGEGTRADICELLKSSQYISPTATDQVLQTIVSGALDRMHTERDPCVKYDAKRKIWIYLHRNRTEQEFERLHMQYQGFTKHKKSIVRKPLRQSKENTSTSNTAKHDLLNDSGTSVESFTLNSSMIEMDQDASVTVCGSGTDPAISTGTAISIAEIPTTSTGSTTVGKSTTSLLKKQTPPTAPSDNTVLHQPLTDMKNDTHSKSVTSDVNSPCQTEQTKQPICIVKEHQTVSTEAGTDVMYKSSSKLCGAVTLISSTGSNLRTIQIPKSSLTLANAPVTSNTGTAIANECSPSNDVLTQDSLAITNPKSPKKILVSAIVSSAKSTISSSAGGSAKSVVDIARISNSKPILVQSIGTASSSHTPATCSFVSSPKDGIKIGTSVGGTIVSIRQVNSNSGISTVGQKNQILACGQTASLLSPRSPAQTKGTQLSIGNASFASSSGASALQTMKGGTVITATIGKPIYSSSVGPSTLKQATNSSTIIQTNLPGTVFSQKMVVSSAKTSTPSSGESSSVPTVVAIKSASSSNMTSVTPGVANRIGKPTTNLFSTITLAKGQQSVLTPAKQRQIIQNLLTQNQKQSLTGTQIVSQAALLAANASSLTNVQAGETKQQYKSSQSYLVENPTAVPAFKINQNQTSTSTIKTISPKIVKITPTRSKPQSAIRPVGSIGTIVGPSNTAVLPTSSVVNQAAASSVKMIKMNPSTILTSTEGHGIANAGTISVGTAMAVTVANNAGTVTTSTAKNATMRVVKTGTGSTTVIKSEVTRGPSVHQLAQSTAPHALENLREDSSSQVGSKLLVNPNINTGQLIPLESLLQKPGLGGTVNNAPGGVNTILKLAGTTKSGQQFIQFGTSSNVSSSATSKSITNLPTNSSGATTVGSVAHQYTILPQTRNIISVATTSTTNRTTSLPITIVSSSSESSESFQSGGSIIVTNKKGNLSEVHSTTDSTTSLLSHVTNSPTAKLMQQGTKVKLLTTTAHNPNSFGSGPVVSASQQQGSVFNSKTSVPSTVNVSGEFLNAKIIGVRNITSAKLKAASSLSLMNASGLNIAHIGGKPVLIANNATVGANQAITVSAAHLNSGSTTKAGPSSAMLLTGNTSCNSLVLGPQNANNVTVSGTSMAGREITRTNVVSGLPGQIQTVLLRNHLLKVQTIPPTAANKLSHTQSIVSGAVSSSGVNSGINPAATTLIATTGRCTTAHSKAQLQQQLQQKSQKQHQTMSAGGTAVILTPNLPPNPMTLGTAVGEETLSNSFVKLQSSNSEISNNSDSVSQSSRVVISQPIIIPSDVQKSGTSINLKRLKVIPISKQPNK